MDDTVKHVVAAFAWVFVVSVLVMGAVLCNYIGRDKCVQAHFDPADLTHHHCDAPKATAVAEYIETSSPYLWLENQEMPENLETAYAAIDVVETETNRVFGTAVSWIDYFHNLTPEPTPEGEDIPPHDDSESAA